MLLKEARKNPLAGVGLPCLETQPRMLWHGNYWDGPLNGVCLLEGQPAWFQMTYEMFVEDIYDLDCEEGDVYENSFIINRVLGYFFLPSKDFEIIKKHHKNFCDYVGNHTNYDEENNRKTIIEAPANIEYNWDKYLEEKKNLPPYPCLDELPMVAWWITNSPLYEEDPQGITVREKFFETYGKAYFS